MTETFQKYGGAGLLLSWFVVAIIYLWFSERQKDRRIFFIYAPVIILVLFFNPLFYSIFSGFTEEAIYFRFLWLLPITPVLAYSTVKICNRFRGKAKIFMGILAALLIVFTGKLVYTNPLFSKAENIYHVPQEVVEICDAIEIEGREVRAVFPEEFLLYVRQYSALVCMPYGRDAMMGEFNELYYVMREDTIVAEKLVELAREEACHYVILSEEKKLLGDLEEYDYEKFMQVGEYIVYKDTTMNFEVEWNELRGMRLEKAHPSMCF